MLLDSAWLNCVECVVSDPTPPLQPYPPRDPPVVYIPLLPPHSSHSFYSNDQMEPVRTHFSCSPQSKVVGVYALLAHGMSSAVERDFRETGLAGSAGLVSYPIRCGIQAVGVLGGDSPGHGQGTKLDVLKSPPTYGVRRLGIPRRDRSPLWQRMW